MCVSRALFLFFFFSFEIIFIDDCNMMMSAKFDIRFFILFLALLSDLIDESNKINAIDELLCTIQESKNHIEITPDLLARE